MAKQCPDCDAWSSSDINLCVCGFVFKVVPLAQPKSAANPLIDRLMREEMSRLQIDQPRPGETRADFLARCRAIFLACKTKQALKQLHE